MSTNVIVHYQTGFKVQHSNPADRPLEAMQNIIHEWLLSKENTFMNQGEKKDFFSQCEWHGDDSVVNTATVDTKDFKAWAFRYVHPGTKMGRGKRKDPDTRWQVDVGIKEPSGWDAIATLYCQVSFIRSRFYNSFVLPTYPATNPKFIREILSEKNGLMAFSSSKEFRLTDKPERVSVGFGKELVDHLQSINRHHVVVVFNPMGSEEILEEANMVARDLAGKSRVMVLDKDPELTEELQQYLSQRLWVRARKFRVYYPINPSFPRPFLHRWFDPFDPAYPKMRKDLVSSLLRTYHLQEEDTVTDISQVKSLIEWAKQEKELTELSSGNRELQEVLKARERQFQKQISEIEGERDQAKLDSNWWMSEYEKIDANQDNMEAKIATLQKALKSRPQEDVIDWFSKFRGRLQTLEETVEFFSERYQDRLIFADEARKSAKKFAECRGIVLDHAWGMLSDIANLLHDLRFGKNKNVDVEKVFGERSQYEYAKTEGKQSKGDKSIRADRQITVNGKKYEIWAHVRWGNKSPKCLRVYLDYDEELKKIVIGYVGDHMPNAGSRKMK